jgi:hypothetical protein
MPTTTTLDAGRELDQRVAIEVMGWGWMTGTSGDVLPFKRWLVPPEEVGDWGNDHPADLSLPQEEPWWLDTDPRNHPSDRRLVPHYSTDIAAAWLVVEKLQGAGDPLKDWFLTLQWSGAEWTATFDRNPDVFEAHEVYAREASVPLAICRAALAAIAGANQGYDALFPEGL